MGARRSVEPSQVRGTEHYILGHDGDQLLTAAHASGGAFRDHTPAQDLTGKLRELDSRSIEVSRCPALGADLGNVYAISGSITPAHSTLPARAVASVAVAAPEAHLRQEDDDDLVALRRLLR